MRNSLNHDKKYDLSREKESYSVFFYLFDFQADYFCLTIPWENRYA